MMHLGDGCGGWRWLVLLLVVSCSEGFGPCLPSPGRRTNRGTTTGLGSSAKSYRNKKWAHQFPTTGVHRELEWESISLPVPIDHEIQVLQSGVLVKRGEFGDLSDQRTQEVEKECALWGMTLAQGLVLRKKLLISKKKSNAGKLKGKRNLKHILGLWQKQQNSLLEISYDLDLPPVSILRALLRTRINELGYMEWDREKIVKSIIYEEFPEVLDDFLMGDWEKEELRLAKDHDTVGYSGQSIQPALWEEALYAFLDQHKINYVKEEELREASMKNTPDCLLLDDCYINGQKVKWIDAKSFFGSGLKENERYSNKLQNQIQRYEEDFGESGAVIFQHGFSEQLNQMNPSTLFLDAGPLKMPED